MKRTLIALLTLGSLSLPGAVYAANPLATDDTGTQGRMKFQAETNAEFGRDRGAGDGTTVRTGSQALNAVVTAGVVDPLDLVLAFPFSWQQVTDNGMKTYDHGGLNDISLALKWRFAEIGPATLAIRPAVTFPSGDCSRGLSNGRLGYGATLISTAEYKPATFSANVGYTHQRYTDTGRDVSRENLWNLSLAGTIEVLTGLQFAAEIGAASNASKDSSNWPIFVTGGVIYSVIDNLDLSLGIKVGLTSPETDLALLPGISFKFL